MPATNSLRVVFAAILCLGPAEPLIAQDAPGAALGALAAEHTAKPARGTDGLAAVPVEITNRGELALSCEVKLAHWYSLTLGTAAYGVTLSTTLWSDPASGAVYLLNPAGDQMAVERVWCGVAEKSWETRFELPLERKANSPEAAQRFSCAARPEGAVAAAATATDCRPK